MSQQVSCGMSLSYPRENSDSSRPTQLSVGETNAGKSSLYKNIEIDT